MHDSGILRPIYVIFSKHRLSFVFPVRACIRKEQVLRLTAATSEKYAGCAACNQRTASSDHGKNPKVDLRTSKSFRTFFITCSLVFSLRFASSFHTKFTTLHRQSRTATISRAAYSNKQRSANSAIMSPYTGSRDDLSVGLDMPMPNRPMSPFKKYREGKVNREASNTLIITIAKTVTNTLANLPKPLRPRNSNQQPADLTLLEYPNGSVFAKRWYEDGNVTIEVLWTRNRYQEKQVEEPRPGLLKRVVRNIKMQVHEWNARILDGRFESVGDWS